MKQIVRQQNSFSSIEISICVLHMHVQCTVQLAVTMYCATSGVQCTVQLAGTMYCTLTVVQCTVQLAVFNVLYN